MRKYFIAMISIFAFVCCNKENGKEDIWEDIFLSVRKTEMSAMEVMSSADFWKEVRTHHYTEPSGKGEEYISYAEGKLIDGHTLKIIAIKDSKFFNYVSNTAITTPYYYSSSMNKLGEDLYSIDKDSKSYYFKILAYDETNLIIETDYFSLSKSNPNGEKSYPYSIVHFKRQFAESPNWADKYISYEEYLKNNN